MPTGSTRVDGQVGERRRPKHLLARVAQPAGAGRPIGARQDEAGDGGGRPWYVRPRGRAQQRLVAAEIGADEDHDLAPPLHVADRVGDAGDGFRRTDPAEAVTALEALRVVDHHVVAVARIVHRPAGRVVQGGGRRTIDRIEQAGAVGSEVLRRAAVGEAAAVDHRSEIARTELVDRRGGDLPRQDLVVDADRPVQHDHHEAAFRLDGVGGDVGGDVADPRRLAGRRCGVRQGHRHERDDRPGLAVLEDNEVRRLKAGDGPPLLVQDRDVQLDDVDAAPEGRRRRLGRRLLLGEDDERAAETADGRDRDDEPPQRRPIPLYRHAGLRISSRRADAGRSIAVGARHSALGAAVERRTRNQG